MNSIESRRRIRTYAVPRLIAVLPVLALLSLGACKKTSEADAADARNAAMTIGTENIAIVTLGDVTSGPTLSGSLLPEREASVRAQVGGSVLQTYAEQGQRVRAGQLLAQIDAAGLQDTFLSARAAVTSARSSADIAARELARGEKLLAAGAIAERDIEQSRRASIAANAGLADARARLANAQKQLSNTRITAPISGVVSDRQVSAGDVVQPGGATFTVVDPSSMRLEASIPAEQLDQVRIGVPVSFTVNGYPGRTLIGRVTRINPTADLATRQVRIIASIPNTSGALVGGLFATGRLASESRSGLIAPVAAIDQRSSVPQVMRIKQGKVERVPVQLGLRDEGAERIQLTAGVQAGDTLLLGAAQGISSGTVIKVSAPTDKAPESRS
ncbi:MAG: efflux RND transporter periplasmic adaptor subunit [Gemmatimonadota bacterium]|nr:efflux RND transporter periplasmic adaptor subunit [Gemmatimonadota bacterium]